MEKLRSLTDIKLVGTSESDEFYIKAGLKGRPYHDEIIRSGKVENHANVGSSLGGEEVRSTRTSL